VFDIGDTEALRRDRFVAGVVNQAELMSSTFVWCEAQVTKLGGSPGVSIVVGQLPCYTPIRVLAHGH